MKYGPKRHRFARIKPGDWLAIKLRWGLTMDPSEYGRLRNLLLGPCAGLSIAPYQPAPNGL